MTDNRQSEPKALKQKIRLFIIICAFFLLLSVSYIMESCGVWEKIFEAAGVASVYEEGDSYPLSITVYDVGNANCVLVRFNKYNILIDCGIQKMQNNISKSLKSKDIERIDLAILSSYDERYIGCMCEVAESVRIDRFITCDNGNVEMPEKYTELLTKLHEQNVSVEYVRGGDEITFEDMNLKIIAPYKVYDKPGDNSLAVRLSYEKFSMLFMGDASRTVQSDMLDMEENLRSDILMIARQGRWDSVTDRFLRAVDPSDAVISVEQTDYIPDDKVIRRIIDYDCNLYRTDYSGNIVIASDGAEYKIITQFK